MMRCLCEHCARPLVYHFWMEVCCVGHPAKYGCGRYCNDGILYVEDYNDIDAYYFYNIFGFIGASC